MKTRTLITVLAATAASVVAAPAAHAEVFCVNAPTCIGTDTDLESALISAQSNGTTDLVRIGPKSTPYTGNATYVSDEKVTVVGAGQDETQLSPGPGAAITFVLRSPGSEVRDLTVNVRNAPNGIGMSINGTAKDVTVRQDGDDTGATGVRLLGGGELSDSLVQVAGRGVVRLEAGTTATVADSVVESGMSGISSSEMGAGVTVKRTRVTSGRSPFFVAGSSTITDVVARSTSPYMDDGIGASSGANVVAHHVTLIGGSMGNALSAVAQNNTTTQLTVRNSIVLGFSRALARYAEPGSTANIGVSYSRVTGERFDDGPGAITTGAGVTALAPQFVNVAGGDYRLRGDSPLIDAGDTQNVLSPDFDRVERAVDGDGNGTEIADMGAFEYRRRAPVVHSVTGPASLAFGETGSYAAQATDADGDPVTYAWTFPGGATATGQTASHAFTTPGILNVVATATDIAGVSASTSKPVTVSAPPPVAEPPAGDPPPGTPPVGGGDSPAGDPPPKSTTPPAKDRLAPVFTSLSASKKAVKFRLSEPAKVSVRVERAKGKGWKKVKSPATAAQAAGARTLSLKKLKLGKGSYRVTLTAVDAAGNKSGAQTVRFRVK